MDQPQDHPGLAEDWALLKSFLPANWQELAASTGALKGLRKDKSAENLLRVLLLHLGCGHSLQETALRARRARLAELTAAAVWNRLQKSADWLRRLCVELFRERGLALAGTGGFQIRALDATLVKEPGRGSLWRIHYSVRCRRWPATSSNSPRPKARAPASPSGAFRFARATTCWRIAAIPRPPASTTWRKPGPSPPCG